MMCFNHHRDVAVNVVWIPFMTGSFKWCTFNELIELLQFGAQMVAWGWEGKLLPLTHYFACHLMCRGHTWNPCMHACVTKYVYTCVCVWVSVQRPHMSDSFYFLSVNWFLPVRPLCFLGSLKKLVVHKLTTDLPNETVSIGNVTALLSRVCYGCGPIVVMTSSDSSKALCIWPLKLVFGDHQGRDSLCRKGAWLAEYQGDPKSLALW